MTAHKFDLPKNLLKQAHEAGVLSGPNSSFSHSFRIHLFLSIFSSNDNALSINYYEKILRVGGDGAGVLVIIYLNYIARA